MKVGDLVRYKQGSFKKVGIITKQKEDCGKQAPYGDLWVEFLDGTCAPCYWRCLELI